MRAKGESQPAAEELAALFRAGGYVRRLNAKRLSAEGYARYKKGDEVRLIAHSRKELARMRRLLREAGFRPGKSFATWSNFRQPLYGRQEVKRFLEMIGEDADA